MPTTILGIDPGTKEMGVVVLRDGKLIAFGVHTLRNGERPHDVIGQARAIIFGLIRDYSPTIVAIEKPLRKATERAALMLVIVQELHARSRELGLRVVEIYPSEVRARVVGDRHAKKFAVAQALVERFPELRARLPAKPPHPVFGYGSRDKYWLHMFDALAVAVVVRLDITQPGELSVG